MLQQQQTVRFVILTAAVVAKHKRITNQQPTFVCITCFRYFPDGTPDDDL